MDYMPGASSLAATHRGKIKNIRLSTLRGDENSADPRASILHFENNALAYDKTTKKETQGTQEIIAEQGFLQCTTKKLLGESTHGM